MPEHHHCKLYFSIQHLFEQILFFHAITQCFEKNNSPSIIFVPINANSHWTLLLLDFERKQYFLFDPLSAKTSKGNQIITSAIEMLEKSRYLSFSFKEIQHNSQKGNWQCGYMVLLCAYKYSMGQPIVINENTINNFRHYLIEILKKSNK